MQSKLLLFLSVFLFISLASASGVSINPSHISLNAFAGEDISQNLTITSDGTYALIINLSNANGITISPSPILVNAGENNITVVFHIPSGISPQVYSEILNAGIQVPDSAIPSTSSSSGSSGGGIRTIYIDKIIYVNNTNQENTPKQEPQIPVTAYNENNDKKQIKKLFIFGVAVSLMLVLSMFYIFLRKSKEEKILKGGLEKN